MEGGEDSMSPQKQLPPKPFGWVEFPKDLQGNLLPPIRRKPEGHDRWRGEYTGTLDCTLTLLTPLHVGSGLFRLANGKVVKEAIRQGEQLIIPGSSLKGVFRSIAEAISLSCVSKTRQNISFSYRECRDINQLCVSCRLFGGLGYFGRVRFHDTNPEDRPNEIHKAPPLWVPKRGKEGRKFYSHGQPATGQEPIEVLPVGTQFDFRVDLESLTRDEMCLLLTSMGIIGGLTPKLGGGKPRCLGSGRVTLQKASFWLPNEVMLKYERDERTLNADQLCAEVEKSNNLIQQNALKKLQAVLNYPQEGECPSEIY